VGQPPKKPSLKVAKSQLEKACPQCDFRFFNGNHFTGCFCFRSLSKYTSVVKDGDSIMLYFDAAWDEDAILALVRSLRESDENL
jgi:hypothetical protein